MARAMNGVQLAENYSVIGVTRDWSWRLSTFSSLACASGPADGMLRASRLRIPVMD